MTTSLLLATLLACPPPAPDETRAPGAESNPPLRDTGTAEWSAAAVESPETLGSPVLDTASAAPTASPRGVTPLE